MRAAVAGVCGLLSPLLLAATLQAQEPERVVRELDFVGQRVHPGRGPRRRHQHHRSRAGSPAFSCSAGSGLGEKRYFDEEEFRRDVIRLHVLYRRSGFPNAQGRHGRPARAGECLHHLPDPGRRADGGDQPPGHRPRLASRLAPAHRGAGPPAPGGRPVQPIPDAGRAPTRSSGGCGTGAIPPRGSSPDSRPTGQSWSRG